MAANARITPPLQGVSSTREDACECRRTGKRSGSALHSDHYDRRRAALSPSADRSGNEREPGQWPDSRQYVSASPGTGKSHVAKALALGAVSRGYKVIYREAHHLIEDINEARELGEIRKYRAQMKSTELLVIDDLFLRKLPASAGDEFADVLMSRYEKSSTHHLESPVRGLGEASRRCRGGHAATRPSHAPRTPAQVRRQELASEGSRRAHCQARFNPLKSFPSRRKGGGV